VNELDMIIRDRIRQHGPISIADYMELALQHPEHGYYRKGDRLGRAGDFITAPEISQMFGEMIGLWCADTWKQLGSPKDFVLVELGPGRGTLMQDALRATKKIKGFHDGLQICMLESNDTFRASQRDKLSGFAVKNINNLSELLPLPMLLIANEFFDALPIRQFMKSPDSWKEQRVGVQENKLVFQPIAAVTDIPFPDANEDHVFEISISSLLMMRDITTRIMRHKGAVLIIDYGYTASHGQSTVQAVSEHSYAPILENAGEVDLTAHVDFAALRQSALSQRASVSPIIGQGEFLNNMGIELRSMQLKQKATSDQVQAIDSALHRLTNSAEMGTLFKVMAVTSLPASSLSGF
jgi:NADH dehydrogenase [ubiquinone] 1 alpha subcomplex assembly factor 7